MKDPRTLPGLPAGPEPRSQPGSEARGTQVGICCSDRTRSSPAPGSARSSSVTCVGKRTPRLYFSVVLFRRADIARHFIQHLIICQRKKRPAQTASAAAANRQRPTGHHAWHKYTHWCQRSGKPDLRIPSLNTDKPVLRRGGKEPLRACKGGGVGFFPRHEPLLKTAPSSHTLRDPKWK